jgi:hypothetical protein
MERITKETLQTRAQNVNRRLRGDCPASVRGHYVLVEYRNGQVALDEYNDGACLRTITVGTKREVADFLHAMMVGIDLSRAE